MIRSRRLRRIVDLATTVERIAASALAMSDKEMAACQKQLEQLRGYRREYRVQLEPSDEPLGAQTLQEYYLFMARLDDIIITLERKLAEQTDMRQQHHEAWMKQRHRVKTLDKIHSRARRDENNQKDANTQRELDDQTATRLTNQ